MKIGFWEATATLVGTIIGAGILGVPYVIAKVGVFWGVIMLLILGIATIVLNLMFTEVVLRTKALHQITGYAKKYLGMIPYRFEIGALLVGSYGAMVAYLIGEGEVLSAVFGGDKLIYSLGFFIFGALILWFGLNLVKIFELWLVFAFIFIVFIIIGFSSSALTFENLQYSNLKNIFTPYGVILFAYGGAASIVAMRQILKRKERQLARAVVIGTVIPMIIYIIFSLIVVGVTGVGTTEVATVGLGQALGPSMILFCNLFAFFAMGTSFLTIGIVMIQFFRFDMKLNKLWSWFLVVIVPLLLFLFVAKDFIRTMGVAGSLSFGLTGIMIVSCFWKVKKKGDRKPEFSLPKMKIFGSLLIVMFLLGIVYTIVDLLS